MAEQEQLTTSQAARILGVSSERVRQLHRAGKLGATETPLGMLFDVQAVGNLLAARRANATRIETATLR